MAPKKRLRKQASTSHEEPLSYDPSRFMTEQHSLKYHNPSFQSTKISYGRTVSFPSLQNPDLLTLLNHQKWKPLLTLSCDSSKPLVREFYANLHYPEHSNSILKSYVRGTIVTLDTQFISNVFGIPNEGFSNFPSKGFGFVHISPDVEITMDEIRQFFGFKTTNPTAISMPPHYRVLHLILRHTITPSLGTFTIVTNNDAFLLWMIIHKHRINLPALILHTISKHLHFPRLFPYGMVLTQIFRYLDIDTISPGDIQPKSKSRPINATTLLKSFTTTTDEGQWVYSKTPSSKDKGASSSSSKPSKPTMDSLSAQMSQLLAFQQAQAIRDGNRDRKLERRHRNYKHNFLLLNHVQDALASSNPDFEPLRLKWESSTDSGGTQGDDEEEGNDDDQEAKQDVDEESDGDDDAEGDDEESDGDDDGDGDDDEDEATESDDEE